jgi:O-antigen ligase
MTNHKIFILTLLAIHASIIDLRFLSSNNVNLYIQMIANILLLIEISKYLSILWKKYKTLNWSAILFSLSYLYSTFNIWHSEIPFSLVSPYTSILQFLKVITLLFFIEYINESKKTILFLKYFLYIVGGYLIIANINIITGIKIKGNDMDISIIGDKFITSYLNLFWISIFAQYQLFTKNKFQLFKYRVLIILSCITASISQCSTGIIVGIFMIGSTYFQNFYKILQRPMIICISILILDLGGYLFYNLVLSIPFIQNIIVNGLGEDLTLTGRTLIWEALATILNERPIWGFGPGNETIVIQNLINLTNAQNGLIHTYLGIGIIGIICFFILLYNIVQRSKYSVIIFFIYGLIIASTIEVTLETSFLCYATFMILQNPSKQLKKYYDD